MAGNSYLTERAAPSNGQDSLGAAAVIAILLRRKWVFIGLIACSTLTVTSIHSMLPTYEAKVELAIQTANSSPLQAVSAKLATLGASEDEGKEVQRFAQRLDTTEFLLPTAIAMRKKVLDLPMFHREMQSTRRRLLWGLRHFVGLSTQAAPIEKIEDSEIADILGAYVAFIPMGSDRLLIRVRSGDKRSAGIVANSVAEEAVKFLLSEGLKDLQDAEGYLEGQAKQIEREIREAGDALTKLKISRGLAGGVGGGLGAIGESIGIQRLLTELTMQLDENDLSIAKLGRELDEQRRKDPTASNVNLDTDNRFGIPQRIAEYKKLNERIQLKISSLRKLLSGMLESDHVSDEERGFELRKRIDFQYSIYEVLKKQAFEINMRRIGANNKVRVGDLVTDGGAIRSDNLPTKILVALILALFCGIPVAVLWELMRPGVCTGRDLTDAGIGYLGAIPKVSGRFAKGSHSNSLKMCRFDSDSEVAMAFIQIRSRLLYLADRKDNPMQVFGVVSAKPGEGKSFFARNLAACFGHMGRRTLLVDCDLRKAVCSEYFGMVAAKGLSEVLSGSCKFGEVVKIKMLKGMDLLPAGQLTTNITDLFSKDAMTALMLDLREVYDHIILDTPSMLAVPDTPLILRTSDMPLLIAAMNETTRSDLEISMDRIRALYTGEIYSVLNRVSGGQVPLYVIHSAGRRPTRTSGLESSGEGSAS